MTLKCPACGKENVEAAKFCKKCGAYLAWQSTTMEPGSDFAATQMAPDFAEPDSDATVIRPAARPAARQTRAPVPSAPDPLLEALADRSSPSASPPRVTAAPAQDAPARSAKTGWMAGALVLTGVLVVLAAALAYWLLGRETAPASVRPPVVAPTASPEPVAAPQPPPPSVAPPIAEPMPPAPSFAPAQPAPEPAAQAPVATPVEPVKPRPKPAPAKPAPVQATPRPVAPPPAPVAPPPPVPAAAEPAPAVPAGPSSPAQACEGKSFFGKPACMNEQCATPRFTKHPQCVEVREQNRRREEQQLRN